MNYFLNKTNRKITIVSILITNIFALVVTIGGIYKLQIIKGDYGYAFTGNILLASITIFFSLLLTILFIYYYLKQSNDKSKFFLNNLSKTKITIFFISFILISSAIFILSFLVFLQRDDSFRWYDGWWRNFK